VCISVKDFDKELNYYTKTLGFREVFAYKDADGKPALTYVQLSRDTFLELQPANADRPPGLSHIGIQVDDLKATMARLESRGVKLEPMRVGPQPGADQRSRSRGRHDGAARIPAGIGAAEGYRCMEVGLGRAWK